MNIILEVKMLIKSLIKILWSEQILKSANNVENGNEDLFVKEHCDETQR